jgi:hypothetical protein
MPHMRISQATLGTFTVGLALSLAAQSAEQALRPCEQIIHACKHAGFVEGDYKKGSIPTHFPARRPSMGSSRSALDDTKYAG